MMFNGSAVFSLFTSPVCVLRISAFPFLTSIVNRGSKPINEYCASFLGPSMDSRR